MKLLNLGLLVTIAVFVVVGGYVYTMPECGNGIVEGKLPDLRLEECDDGNIYNGDGCSSVCKVEFPFKIYVAHYLGNVDGGFDPDWFFFYGQLSDHFWDEKVPVGATVYPTSINETQAFAPYIKDMYDNPYVTLVQKGNTGLGVEKRMDSLSAEEQTEIIGEGRKVYLETMADILDVAVEDVDVPRAYNQPQGRFNNDTRQALETLDFKIFFEMYMNEDIGPIDPTKDLDIVQYGVGFTKAGVAGKQAEFFEPGEFLINLRNFRRDDLNMVYINGSRMVPVWVHHMDFERQDKDNMVDREKWATYKYIINRINEEPNLVWVSPMEIYELRHPKLVYK